MNKGYKIFTLMLVPVLFFSTGCATIFKGSNADIRVNSAPAGADIYINNIDRGQTPQTLSLARNKDHVLVFKKDGFEDVTIEVNRKFDVATTIVGNLFSFALLGVVVDVATGAAYSLQPADVQANMPELRAAGLIPDGSDMGENDLMVVMISKEDWERISASK